VIYRMVAYQYSVYPTGNGADDSLLSLLVIDIRTDDNGRTLLGSSFISKDKTD